MSESENSGVGDEPPPYMIFVVVFLFFLTGLLGFLVCHLLKKKGYRCRTGDLDFEEEEDDKLAENADDNEENQDTVEQILKCIIENEANMEAFNEMLKNHNVCVRHDPRSRKDSVAGVPSHHHTVHSGSDHNSCHLCAQVRSKKGRRQSRTPRFKQRPGEQTVFSVGRFRVTHHDKKLQGSPNPMAASDEQLDQSQDGAGPKESAYNLRNMFRDVGAPSESSGGVAPNEGKRRKSVGIFGLRRGSDPTGVRAGQGPGGGGVARVAAAQHHPAVLEEGSQPQKLGVLPQPVGGAEISRAPRDRAQSVLPGHSPPSQRKMENLPAERDPVSGARPEAGHSRGGVQTAPRSLPLQAVCAVRSPVDAEDVVIEDRGLSDSGPLQTSTPVAPTHSSSLGFAPFASASRPERCASREFPVTQTPPDPSCSQESEAHAGSSLALISLGSSPLSSSRVKIPSVSSLKSPSSPLSDVSTPKSSADTLSESVKLDGSGTPKTERKRPGILKAAKPSPPESSSKVLSMSSPTDQPRDPRVNLPLAPSPPAGTSRANVTIVKASPDSKREFSVVTMVEEKESAASPEDKARGTSELGAGSEKSSTPSVLDVGKPRLPPGENSSSADGPSSSQEKDDMVEMEDIQDCKVMQVEEAKRTDG